MKVQAQNMEALFMENQSLVYFTLRKYDIHPPAPLDFEDLVQIGNMGLWKAVQTYNPETSAFATYAVTVIVNEIFRELRLKRYKVEYTSLNVTINENEEDKEIEFGDTIASTEDLLDTVVTRDLLSRCMEAEPELTLLALQGYTQKQIGEKLGYSQSHVSRKLRILREQVAS